MKIGVIGRIGKQNDTSSGQEIRTKILLDSLKGRYGQETIMLIDTAKMKESKLKGALNLLKGLFICDRLILIVSSNGLHFFLPILFYLSKVFRKKVYNNVIGGNILELIHDNKQYIHYMNGFIVNWVQMQGLVDGLTSLGVNNAALLPNSKPLKIFRLEDLSFQSSKPVKFCTFSRISKEKGIELAIQGVEMLNKKYGANSAVLDIYGVPDKEYKQRFEEVLSTSTVAVAYKGLVPYDKTSDVLKDYFMLLFPTTFNGEGFPGTILDAYSSGLPVLASTWSFNPELIKDGVNGILYDYREPKMFLEKLDWAYHHVDNVRDMRRACLLEAGKYIPENVMPLIFNKLDNP